MNDDEDRRISWWNAVSVGCAAILLSVMVPFYIVEAVIR